MIAGLPYDAEIEYLESSGTQWIDTGIVPTIDTSAEMDVMETSWRGWSVFLGSATSDNNADSWYFRTGGNGPDYSFRIDGKAQDSAINVALGTRFVATVSKNAMTVNGITKVIGASEYSSQPVLPMYLFACNLNGATWRSREIKGRVYSCKIFNGATIVRDFLPVRFTNELGQTEGAMYDRVSRKLFRNRGTGAFGIGPDVAVPVMGLHFMRRPMYTAKDYMQNGLLAMWDGIENAGWGVHDASPTEIADLVGSSPLTISNASYVEIGPRYFQPDASHGGATVNSTTYVLKNALDANSATIEICASFASIQGGEWFSVDDSTRLYNVSGVCPQWLRVGGSLANVSSLSQPLDTLITIAIRIGGGGSAIFLNGVSQFAISKGSSTIPVGVRVARNMIGMRVHCFRISTALTDAQIAHNYAVDKERFNLP